MLRVLWCAVALSASPLVALADVCLPGSSLTYPNHAIVGRLGLSAIVDARDDPAFADDREMTVGARIAASEAFFAAAYGDEPQGVQDLRQLGTFVEQFQLTRNRRPSISDVYFEPEYVVTLLPVLRQYEIDSGVAALEATAEAFWFFEDVRTSSLLTQLMFDDVIGATIDEARDAAPDLLAAARGEVDVAVAEMEAEDPSVAAMMIYLREGVPDWILGSYLANALWDCIGDHGDRTFWERPENWDALPQLQRDLLVLLLLEHQMDHWLDMFARYGWLMDDAVQVTEQEGLAIFADMFRQVLALYPEGAARDGDAWHQFVWSHPGEIEDIVLSTIYDPLSVQQQTGEVVYSAALWEAYLARAQQAGLWPRL